MRPVWPVRPSWPSSYCFVGGAPEGAELITNVVLLVVTSLI